MRENNDDFLQSTLINNFNSFARQARDYLGIEIEPLNKEGCCFALAQFHIQATRVGNVDEFYGFYQFITQHLTPNNIPRFLEKIKSENEKNQSGTTNFFINTPTGGFQYDKLVIFMQTLALAQVGYSRVISKSRHAQKKGQWNLGHFESIGGNWEASYPLCCTAETIPAYLGTMRLVDQHYALISSGNHAINFTRQGDGHYIVYDANNKERSAMVQSLDEVGTAIMVAFKKVGCVSSDGYVSFVVDTVSFNANAREFDQALRACQITFSPEGMTGVCQSIVLEYLSVTHPADLENTAVALTNLYHNSDISEQLTLTEFIETLPMQFKTIVRMADNYLRQNSFSRSINHLRVFNTQDCVSQNQLLVATRINDYLAQYNDGHLSRQDLAVNLVELIQSHVDIIEIMEESADILKLQQDLTSYLNGAVTAAQVIESGPRMDLRQRDKIGHNCASIALTLSANKHTLKAIIGHSDTPFIFEGNSKDKEAVYLLVQYSNIEVIEYVQQHSDMIQNLSDEEVLTKSIASGNIEIAMALLEYRPEYDMNICVEGRTPISYAFAHRSVAFATYLLGRGGHLMREQAIELLDNQPHWGSVIDCILRSDSQANITVLFSAAISRNQVGLANHILLNCIREPSLSMQQELLLKAIGCGDAGIVEGLVRQNPELINLDAAPLVHAVMAGDIMICNLLLEAGANRMACAKADGLSAHLHTPIMAVMKSSLSTEGKEELIKILFKGINTRSFDRNSVYEAVVAAAQNPNTSVDDMKMLRRVFNIDFSTMPNKKDINLAMYCLSQDNFELMSYCIKKAAKAKAANDQRAMAQTGEPDSNSAAIDLAATDVHGRSLLLIALERICIHSQQTEDFLQDPTVAKLSAYAESIIEKIPLLLNKCEYKDGNSPFLLAALSGHARLVRVLLKSGSDPLYCNHIGNSALHMAVQTGNRAVIELLINENQQLLTVKNVDGQTALQLVAQQMPSLENLEPLLTEQSLQAVDAKGNTLLHDVIPFSQNIEIIRALLDRGMNPMQKNTNGLETQSPLDIALLVGNYPAVVAIVERMPCRYLEAHPDVLALMMPHREALFNCLDKELGQAYFDNSQDNSLIIDRVDAILNKQNGLSILFKAERKRIGLRVDVDARFIDALKQFKTTYLLQGSIEPEQQKQQKYL